ncbi:helix-turn-helix transcriptional regulator [Streptomyces sp. NPDC002088]|uniref:helix-turn-helix domain-containing protein n=1 Tax=Streptomyces sp. NPDC002088 TaxID=3154665 RepID=UPI00332751FA
MSEGTAGAGFAELLRELKERSGLSYGVLGKRLHMSTSTLHRYCNGDAVPTDYAPVERLARLCKASSDELVELHRRWVLADAVRGRKEPTPEPRPRPEAAPGPTPEPAPEPTPEPAPELTPELTPEPAPELMSEPTVTSGPAEAGEVVPETGRRTRTALIAGLVVAAVLGAVTLALGLPSGGSDGGDGSPVGAASGQGAGGGKAARTPDDGASASASASASPSGSGSPSPSAPASTAASVSASAEGGQADGGDAASDAVPLTVTTSPYTWESPCSQHYLIDRPPGEVSPPPLESDATAWVAAHKAVSSGEQFVTLTVQGTGQETVVVDSLTVRTSKSSPLAWNDYAMGYPGVGCGGGVPTRSFTVALDAARPAVVPEAGHRDFPFKVSESDPEVYYITADASAYDVSWYLELAWSSGSRHGTLRIDDHGRPFRTSGNNGRPAYEFPLGGSGWVKAGTTS